MRWYRVVVRSPWAGFAATVFGTMALVAIMAPFRDSIGLLNAGLVLLLFVLGIAAVWGRNVGVFAALVANLALNFFFIDPLHRLAVADAQNVMALAVFLSVSVIGGTLVSNARRAESQALQRERETQTLMRLNRAMVGRTDPQDALAVCCTELVAAIDASGAAVLSRQGAEWSVVAVAGAEASGRAPGPSERFMAEQALSSGVATGLGHTGLLARRRPRVVLPLGRRSEDVPDVTFVPLRIADRTMGVLRVDGPLGDRNGRSADARRLLPAFAGEAALALQRIELAAAASHAEALQRADQFKSAMLASVSHDLKTPLAAIRTAITSLQDTSIAWGPADAAMFRDTIDVQSARLDRVISDMLDLTRIEAGALTPMIEPIAAAELVRGAIEGAAASLSGRNVWIEVPPELELLGDEVLLTQALVNLLDNAAKYSPPDTAITVSAHRHGPGVEISVEDEGEGIRRSEQPYVFDRFWRGPRDRERISGSGLGLAVVRGFVEACGGSVRVEMLPGGTGFVITLPSAQAGVPA